MGRRSPFSAGAEERFQKAQGRVSGITLDAGGLIALDRNDRRVLALVARATERGMRITIPATALAQAILNPAKQARLSRLIRQASTDLVDLDGPDARACFWRGLEPLTLSTPTSPSARSEPAIRSHQRPGRPQAYRA